MMSDLQKAARSTVLAGAWAVLFIASMSGMRYLNALENGTTHFVSWHLRGAVETE